eukprot:6126743-Heterocapsa_arctica.AAC.1
MVATMRDQLKPSAYSNAADNESDDDSMTSVRKCLHAFWGKLQEPEKGNKRLKKPQASSLISHLSSLPLLLRFSPPPLVL